MYQKKKLWKNLGFYFRLRIWGGGYGRPDLYLNLKNWETSELDFGLLTRLATYPAACFISLTGKWLSFLVTLFTPEDAGTR